MINIIIYLEMHIQAAGFVFESLSQGIGSLTHLFLFNYYSTYSTVSKTDYCNFELCSASKFPSLIYLRSG
jgi:hypothetical protein